MRQGAKQNPLRATMQNASLPGPRHCGHLVGSRGETEEYACDLFAGAQCDACRFALSMIPHRAARLLFKTNCAKPCHDGNAMSQLKLPLVASPAEIFQALPRPILATSPSLITFSTKQRVTQELLTNGSRQYLQRWLREEYFFTKMVLVMRKQIGRSLKKGRFVCRKKCEDHRT